MNQKFSLNVNGKTHTVEADADMPLLYALRNDLGLNNPHFGCGLAQCGACTVHLDGDAARSCSITAGAVEGQKIVTIEGLSPDGSHPVQQAWLEVEVPQCGYCQIGMMMAAAALLRDTPKPTDAEIDKAISNICRCGTYTRIRQAIHVAAAKA